MWREIISHWFGLGGERGGYRRQQIAIVRISCLLFSKRKKNVFEMLFLFYFKPTSWRYFFFWFFQSQSYYGLWKVLPDLSFIFKNKNEKKIWRRKHSSWYDRAIREKCQLADAVFLDYEMATHISWNKKENENTGCLACLSVISYIRKVADHLEDGVIFPSILVFYESKACLGGKQLSSGELTNSKCQILLQEIRKAVKL